MKKEVTARVREEGEKKVLGYIGGTFLSISV
jgi:hypothetical protein